RADADLVDRDLPEIAHPLTAATRPASWWSPHGNQRSFACHLVLRVASSLSCNTVSTTFTAHNSSRRRRAARTSDSDSVSLAVPLRSSSGIAGSFLRGADQAQKRKEPSPVAR